MAVIPTIDEQRVGAAPLARVRSPNVQGDLIRSVGAGIAGASQAVAQVADLQRRRADEAVVNRAVAELAQWQRGSLYDDGGVLSQRGAHAIKAHTDARAQWQEQYGRISSGLTPLQQQRFEGTALRMSASYGLQLARHEFSERNQMEDDAFRARVEASVQTAIGYASAYPQLSLEVAETSEAIGEYWSNRGAPAEVIQQRQGAYESAALSAAVGSLIQGNQPQQAQALLKEVGDRLTPDDRSRLLAELEPELIEQGALALHDEFMESAGAGTLEDYQRLERESMKIDDPRARDAFQRRVAASLGQRQQNEVRRYRERVENLDDDLRANPRALSARERAWLQPGEEDYFDARFVESLDPGKRTSDLRELHRRYWLLEPDERAAVDLRHVYPYASDQDFKEMRRDQVKQRDRLAADGDASGLQARAQFEQRAKLLASELARNHLDKSEFRKAGDAFKAGYLRRALDEFDSAFPEGNASPDDQNAILDRLSLSVKGGDAELFGRTVPAAFVDILERPDRAEIVDAPKLDDQQRLVIQNFLHSTALEQDPESPRPSMADAENAYKDAVLGRRPEILELLDIVAPSEAAPAPVPREYELSVDRFLQERGVTANAQNRFDAFAALFAGDQIAAGEAAQVIPPAVRRHFLVIDQRPPAELIGYFALRAAGIEDADARARAGIPAEIPDFFEQLMQGRGPEVTPDRSTGAIEGQDVTPFARGDR